MKFISIFAVEVYQFQIIVAKNFTAIHANFVKITPEN